MRLILLDWDKATRIDKKSQDDANVTEFVLLASFHTYPYLTPYRASMPPTHFLLHIVYCTDQTQFSASLANSCRRRRVRVKSHTPILVPPLPLPSSAVCSILLPIGRWSCAQ